MKNRLFKHYLTLGISLLSLIFIAGMCTSEDPAAKPIAYFTYSPSTNLVAPVTIYFSNLSTDAADYVWTYGNGQTNTDKDLSLRVSSGGTYTITLKATGKGGTDSYSRTVTVANPSSTTPLPPTTTPPTTPPPTTPPPTTTPNRTVTNPGESTFFIASQNKTFSKHGDWTAEGFTISKSTTFVFRFASQYKAQAAIVTETELNNFKTMNAFRGFGIFDNQYGYTSVTLAAGKYYVAVRNTNNGANITSTELDYAITLPSSDRCRFYDTYIKDIKSAGAGGRIWHGFTIQSGFRYFMEGCNTGYSTNIIPENQLDNFKNGRTFTVFTDYDQAVGGAPGLYEVKLPPGTYYFVAHNKTNATQAIVYTMERWQLY